MLTRHISLVLRCCASQRSLSVLVGSCLYQHFGSSFLFQYRLISLLTGTGTSSYTVRRLSRYKYFVTASHRHCHGHNLAVLIIAVFAPYSAPPRSHFWKEKACTVVMVEYRLPPGHENPTQPNEHEKEKEKLDSNRQQRTVGGS